MIVVLWARRPARRGGAGAWRTRPRPRHGSLLVRGGKGARRRDIGMDAWAWEHPAPWLAAHLELPV